MIFASKKNLYTLLVIVGIPVLIVIILGICTLLNTFCIDHFPSEVPDRIVVFRIYPEGCPLHGYQHTDYLEITDGGVIADTYERLQSLVYTFRTSLRFGFGQGYHPYVLRLYYGDDYCEYDFDFNYVGDYGGVRYTTLGDQLRWLFDMLEDDGEAVAWDEGGTFVS